MESDFGIYRDSVNIIGSISYENIPGELLISLKRKMQSARRLLILEGKRYINRIVPKDSGDLRKSMIKTLEMGKVYNEHYTLYIGTPNKRIGIYMQVVNENYREKRLAHTGQKYYGKKKGIKNRRPSGISHATGKVLYDPHAKKRFLEKITRKILGSLKTRMEIIKKQLIIEATRFGLDTSESDGWLILKGV